MRKASYTIELKDGKTVDVKYWSFHKTDKGMGLFGSRTAAIARGDWVAARQFDMQLVILATSLHDPEKLAELVNEDMGNYELLLNGITKHESDRLDEQMGYNEEESDEGNAEGGD